VPPRIIRLHGTGAVAMPGDDGFADLAGRFTARPGIRSIIQVAVARIADSCGYAVPRMDLVAERTQLERWAARKGPDGLATYRRTRNARSIDGLPALDPPPG
jgi:hypothetical protein